MVTQDMSVLRSRLKSHLESVEKVVEQLGLFYAEELEVRTPPDPIERP